MSPIGFKFTLKTKEKVDFFSNSANIPSIALGTALQGTTFRILDVPGDEVIYEDFSMNFWLMRILKIIWLSITGLLDWNTRNFKQFRDLTKDPETVKEMILQFCDGTLHILNSNYRDIAMVKFRIYFQ